MPTTITTLLRGAIPLLTAAGVANAQLDAELLLSHLLRCDRKHLWMYPEETVQTKVETEYRRLLLRRQQREPLAYILGEWEFYGRRFFVTPDVLIPRPETELLVEAVLAWSEAHSATHLVDVGTGSGAIAVTVAAETTGIDLTAIDISPAALAVACRNADRHGVATRIAFLAGDLLEPLSAPADVIVANLPYVAREDEAGLMPEVRDFEPHTALFAPGEEPLSLVYRVIDEASSNLYEGGLLALEVGFGQAASVAAVLREGEWGNIHVIDDYAGIARHVCAERSA